MANYVTSLQTISISTALITSGGIAVLTLFDVPELQSQPASRSLPLTRWLFSRGSHLFPQAAALSSAGFTYLAYNALPPAQRAVVQLGRLASNGTIVNGYLAAALLTISIAPWTTLVMIPTNFAIIKLNADIGGFRSEKSADLNTSSSKANDRSAGDSVNSKGEAQEFTDLTGPQSKTTRDSTGDEDRKAKELLKKFGRLNAVRAVLIGAGGILGLLTALTP